MLRVLGGSAIAACAAAPSAWGAIVAGGDGTQNTTAPAGASYWNNLGSIPFGSGVYLGNGWVLTAGHAHGGNQTLPFTMPGLNNGAGATFNSIPGVYMGLRTPSDGLPADLTVFRLNPDPLLSQLPTIRFGATPQVGTGITITGAGYNRLPDLHYWRLSDSAHPDKATWTDVTGAPNQGTAQARGYLYDTNTRASMRWGTNATFGFDGNAPTDLYTPKDASGNPVGSTRIFGSSFEQLTNEAQLVPYDSGGGVFVGNRLVGLNLLKGDYSYQGASNPNNLGQPANTAVFGNTSYFADLFTYVDQIAGITKVHPGIDGDANLDGVVDFTDFRLLYDNLYTASGWTKGDFNLDGQVNFADYQMLERNYGKSDGAAAADPTPLPSFASVPEPGALGVIGLGVLAMVSRRRTDRR